MTLEYSPTVVPMTTSQVQAPAVDPALKPADSGEPRAAMSGVAPPTWVAGPPPEGGLRATRQSQLDQLRDLQGQFLTSAADLALVTAYAPRFVQYADDVYAASSERDLVRTGLQIDQLKFALQQFRRMMARRDTARLHAVALLVLMFGFLITITAWDDYFSLDVTDEIRLLHVPIYVIVWSVIGSVCSLLYRFNHSADAEMDDPMRVLLTRPLMGVVLGSFSYLVVRLGFLTMSENGPVPGGLEAAAAQIPPNDRVVHLMIVVAFIVGFSDRLSEQILRSLVGRFGGDQTGQLVSLDRLSPAVDPSAMSAILNAGGSGAAGSVRASTDTQGATTTSSNGLAGPSVLPRSDPPGAASGAL